MIKKEIPQNEWSNRLDTISSGNTGCMISINEGENLLVENRGLIAIVYDSTKEDSSITIDLDDFSHTIQNPRQMLLHRKSNGQLLYLEIVNSIGMVSFINFL